MRDRKLYSPPERGKAVASSAYESAPHSATRPPSVHSVMTVKPDGRSMTWKPRLVNTPMPIMSATASAVAVVKVTLAGPASLEGAGSELSAEAIDTRYSLRRRGAP